MREQRRLAAVVAADVVGYSRLMGRDEAGTLAALKALRREVIDPPVAVHGGRIVKTAGDGLLLEFPSVVDAMRCVLEVQTAMADRSAAMPAERRISFRIGVNIGDIIIEDGDIFGDGVNVAARLQEIAEPGGVAVSSRVYDDVRDRLDATFTDAGPQALKNIARPVHTWRWSPGIIASQPSPAPLPPNKPSIAVLPLMNLSDDPKQDYFADGIAEDVITTLSKIRQLTVIARHSSFVFKGVTKDIREIGRTLGVRYVLEGSVRKIGNHVRLTAQLIDSLDGSHLWADKFDGDLDDVFALQDRITQEIVTALEVRLTLGESVRVWRKRSGSPLAYEHLLSGRDHYVNFQRHSHAQAKEDAERALAINAACTPAWHLMGLVLVDQARFGWVQDKAAAYDAAHVCADRAFAVDPDSWDAYLTRGYVCLFQRRHDEAIAAGERALTLGPSSSDAYHMAGMFHGYGGDFRRAATYEEQSQRLSPLSPIQSKVDEARARFHLGDLTAARDIALGVLRTRPQWLTAKTTAIAALWKLGSCDEAQRLAKDLLAGQPRFSVDRWAAGLPYRRQEDLVSLVHPLRMAGLPE